MAVADKKMRTETDSIGPVQIPVDALYGIHALRASLNFPDLTRFHQNWYCALGSVKRACYITYRKFAAAIHEKYPHAELPFPMLSPEITEALITAAAEVESGMHFGYFIVPAVQGGAGTSINLNMNEIIANRALQLTGKAPGQYGYIHPIDHANIYQSTNDVVPTALKIAILHLLKDLENSINLLRSYVEAQEKNSRDHMRIGYTEMQEAVPSTYGRLFSAYNDALSRDWWRTSKCSERIKTVNLGGSAIGTGITVPAYFINEAARTLNEITGLQVSRAENLHDATSNLDSFVEIHAILKAHAVNLEKIVSDIRLLASDLMKGREMQIPRVQTGSSIMPGKINPVIPEYVISACHKVYSNDALIGHLAGQGCLDLNAYLPLIGHAMIESLQLLTGCNRTFSTNLFKELILVNNQSLERLFRNPAITTALIPYIGYTRASKVAQVMMDQEIDVAEACRHLHVLNAERLLQVLSADNLLKEGFSINDVINND